MTSSDVTIITGGGRGIGRAITLRLGRETNVLVVGRSEPELESVVAEITKAGGRAIYVQGDVRDPATAERAVERAQSEKWRIRSLVCNAGVGKSSPTHELSDEMWANILDTNLSGAFYFSRAVLPIMRANRQGSICFIGSTASFRGFSHEAAYTASKHAVVGLAKAIAAEYGKDGIVSVPVCPNFVEGEMTDRTISGLANRRGISIQEARSIVERKNPQRRIIPAEEVAEVVAFVCSGAAPGVSGQPIILGSD